MIIELGNKYYELFLKGGVYPCTDNLMKRLIEEKFLEGVTYLKDGELFTTNNGKEVKLSYVLKPVKYNYKNLNYERVEGKSLEDIKGLLLNVHKRYPEYCENPFLDMVKLFARDDFYKYHYLAQEYLHLTK